MSVSTEEKEQFLVDFQRKIMQGRKLLHMANHRWADKLFTDLFYDIEKKEWLDVQKKHQFVLIISNSWWIYINSLTAQKEKGIDIVRYLDAYKRFFSFLSKLDDFYLFTNFCNKLLESFIQREDLSQTGITKFINSFSEKLKDKENYLKLIELQILLMFLRESVIPSELFNFSMNHLGKIIFKLEPSKRALFLYIFIEDINIKYNLMEDSNEFVAIVQKLLVNRLTDLKEVFSGLSRVSINERNFTQISADLEDLIYYLNNIGESSWIIIVIRNLFAKFQEFQSFDDATSYVRRFIDLLISRNRFEIAFEIFDFLEDLFMYQTDLGYDTILIELWVEACKRFVDISAEKKYLLQSLEKLSNHLKIPQKSAQIFHFFYTSNYLWKFKGHFFTLEQRDFWRMLFYRALFEEKDFDLADRILPHLDRDITSNITDLNALYNIGESLKPETYNFNEEFDDKPLVNASMVINQVVIRINSEGTITYRMLSTDNQIIEGKITSEVWNDAIILDIFNELLSDKQEKEFNFNLQEFGRLLYLLLPRSLKELFNILKSTDLTHIHFVLDHMTVPFELVFNNNTFYLLKYSISYKIGEPPLSGIAFEQLNQQPPTKSNILIIETINAREPLKWNEEKQNKDLIFPFGSGAEELNYITNFFNLRDEVHEFNILHGINSTREKILSNLSEGAYQIIHFVGNIFYSKWSPQDSFLITNDKNVITFTDIYNAIHNNEHFLKPFLFFNCQVYNFEGERLNNALRSIGNIVANFNYDSITGIMARSVPFFTDETKELTSNFYIGLLLKNSQGGALLNARQKSFEKNPAELGSYVLFGEPWKRM